MAFMKESKIKGTIQPQLYDWFYIIFAFSQNPSSTVKILKSSSTYKMVLNRESAGISPLNTQNETFIFLQDQRTPSFSTFPSKFLT